MFGLPRESWLPGRWSGRGLGGGTGVGVGSGNLGSHGHQGAGPVGTRWDRVRVVFS